REPAQWRRLLVLKLVDKSPPIIGWDERRALRQHLVGNDAQAVNIRRLSQVYPTTVLLRRHILRCSHHRAGFGYLRICETLFAQSGDPKVEHLDRLFAIHVLHHDVIGLKITVDDSLSMRGVDRFASLRQDLYRAAVIESLLPDQMTQRQ